MLYSAASDHSVAEKGGMESETVQEKQRLQNALS